MRKGGMEAGRVYMHASTGASHVIGNFWRMLGCFGIYQRRWQAKIDRTVERENGRHYESSM
jgi:hypothetical protein